MHETNPWVRTWELYFTSILKDIAEERHRQECLKSEGKFLWTCDDLAPSHADKLAVLGEEYGEVARSVVEFGISKDKYERAGMVLPPHRVQYYLQHIRTELIQVAAVCVAWCEAIDATMAKMHEVEKEMAKP